MLNRAVAKKGFTLVELLVVIAISTVLFGLVMYPLIKSFNMTRSAQIMVDAQDSARLAVSQISRDVSEAMFIYDSVDTDAGSPTFGTTAVSMPVRLHDASLATVYLPDARMDMIPPKMIIHCNNPAHPASEPRDFNRRDDASRMVFAWRACPVCGSNDVEIRPELPLKHDSVIVRYFLGLRNNDPAMGWKPYDRESKAPGQENSVVLYRVEFDPNDGGMFPSSLSDAQKRDVYNAPGFFYDSSAAADGRPYWQHWKEIASPVASARYQDLVNCQFDAAGDPQGIVPTVSLRFGGVENVDFRASASPQGLALGYDSVPTVFRAPDGYWVSSFSQGSQPSFNVSVFKSNGNTAFSTAVDNSGDLIVWRYSQSGGNWQTPVAQFNISQYMRDGSIVRPGGGYPEMAFVVDWNKGLVDFAIIPQNYNYPGPDCISPLDPDSVNDDIDRRALLLTYDSASNNYLGTNARIIPDTIRVQVPVGLDSGGDPVYVRYLRTDESNFKPARNQFWLEGPDHIRFADDLPVVSQGGHNLPVLVDYQVQYNSRSDSVRGSYSSKSRVDITVGMRVYNLETRIPNIFALRETVVVGNALR